MADTPIDIAAAIAAIDQAVAPLVAARSALQAAAARENELMAQAEAADARANAAETERDALATGADGKPPKLPRVKKLWGTAHTIDQELAVYTEAQMAGAQQHAHALGVAHGRTLGPREPGIGYTETDGLYDDEQMAQRLGEHDRAAQYAAQRRALVKQGSKA